MKTILKFYLTAFLFIGACSNSDSPEQGENIGIDPTLVGTWVGTITGGLGEADITIILKSDGTMSGEGKDSPYCPLKSTWEVKNETFVAKGNDECDGTSVTLTADYSATRLQGSWSASSGNNGTFDVSKQ